MTTLPNGGLCTRFQTLILASLGKPSAVVYPNQVSDSFVLCMLYSMRSSRPLRHTMHNLQQALCTSPSAARARPSTLGSLGPSDRANPMRFSALRILVQVVSESCPWVEWFVSVCVFTTRWLWLTATEMPSLRYKLRIQHCHQPICMLYCHIVSPSSLLLQHRNQFYLSLEEAAPPLIAQDAVVEWRNIQE